MTPPTPGDPAGELDRLLAALVEGGLSPAEQGRLSALLREHPELRTKYLDYLLLDSLLQWEQPEPARPEPRRPARRWWPVMAAAGALAAAVLAAVLLWPRHPSHPQGDLAAERTDDSVAVLLHTSGAVWGESTVPTRPGAPLPPGRMRLTAGVVRLEFYCGATVILEGPADFELISRKRAYCTAGKLRATVPPQAEGFTIGTPATDVVDRGTEFGLRVGGGDKTEVHVFQGRVDLYDAGAGGRDPARRALTTGEGVRLDPGGAADPIRPDPAAFKTARQLEDELTADCARRQREWQAASEEWRRDPALRAYFTFQDGRPWGRTLTDHAGRQPACDGAIVGCSWVTGRWPGRHGLEFKRVSDRVRLTVPGEFDSVTLAAWVRVDGLPNKNNSLMMADGWEDGELHWQIGDDGTAILGVQSSPKGRGAHYHAPGAVTPDRFGQWLHLAVVYDRDAGRVRHYVDGRQASDEPTQFDIPLRIGDAEIGNWNVAAHRNKTVVRYLNGCMDEVMLFTRALSGDELARLYAQGRPPY
jgi:ferric-dicitrate binding protein FerR (iron transport regulator)